MSYSDSFKTVGKMNNKKRPSVSLLLNPDGFENPLGERTNGLADRRTDTDKHFFGMKVLNPFE